MQTVHLQLKEKNEIICFANYCVFSDSTAVDQTRPAPVTPLGKPTRIWVTHNNPQFLFILYFFVHDYQY